MVPGIIALNLNKGTVAALREGLSLLAIAVSIKGSNFSI